MDRYDEMRTLLCSPYALRADGTVLSAGNGEDPGWTGVKKLCGDLALRWDGRVLCRGWGERVNYISQWRNVVDIACCGPIELCLTRTGELTWVRSRHFQISQGYCAAGWTDVEQVFVVCDPYSDEMSYADYAVGLCGDGHVRVAYLGGGEDRSREIETLLGSVGPIKRISGDCRALTADGRIYDFSTRNMGKTSREPIPGFDRTEDGCILLENGIVQVPEGQYPGAENWRSILCISGCFLPIETGRHILMGLRKDGRVMLAERYGNVTADVSDWKLFDHPDTFAWEREKASAICISEGLALDLKEESDRRLEKLKALTRDKVYAETALEEKRAELARAKGPFSGKKRVRLEQEISALEEKLADLKERLM